MLTLLLLLSRIIRVENKLARIAPAVERQHFQQQVEIEVKVVRQIAACTISAADITDCTERDAGRS
ncbi:hypothetical protein CKF43_05330 [Pantoea graminicola]|nr:hypothetical protein CKF43_05330 [Pantoea sp. ARC607]